MDLPAYHRCLLPGEPHANTTSVNVKLIKVPSIALPMRTLRLSSWGEHEGEPAKGWEQVRAESVVMREAQRCQRQAGKGEV